MHLTETDPAIHVADVEHDTPPLDAALRNVSRPDQVRATTMRHGPIWLRGRAWLRSILAFETGCSPSAVQLARQCASCGSTAHGKLFTPSVPSLDFSVSHSGPYIACAVSHSSIVGIDLEPNHRNVVDLVSRFCTAKEAAYIARARNSDKQERALRIWVRKEAVLKACGLGLSAEMCRIDVMEPTCILRGKAWELIEPPSPFPLVIAVAFAKRHSDWAPATNLTLSPRAAHSTRKAPSGGSGHFSKAVH